MSIILNICIGNLLVGVPQHIGQRPINLHHLKVSIYNFVPHLLLFEDGFKTLLAFFQLFIDGQLFAHLSTIC